MIKNKSYLVFTLLCIFSIMPLCGMQKGLGYIKKKLNLESHYDVLEVNCNATPAEIKKAYHKSALINHTDKGGDEEQMKKVIGAYEALTAFNEREKRQYDTHCTFVNCYIIGGLLFGTSVTIAGLIKAWQWYKEYSSPCAILLDKMEIAANRAVTVILNLEFDRYNPTKDTESLSMQFDVEPLLKQLSSDEIRNKVKHTIVKFDKTLEAMYEQCAWHYYDMHPEDFLIKNPSLVQKLRNQLQNLLETIQLCKSDLELDRNKPLEFIKAYYKKMIGFGLAGLGSWYAFQKITALYRSMRMPQEQQIRPEQGQIVLFTNP